MNFATKDGLLTRIGSMAASSGEQRQENSPSVLDTAGPGRIGFQEPATRVYPTASALAVAEDVTESYISNLIGPTVVSPDKLHGLFKGDRQLMK